MAIPTYWFGGTLFDILDSCWSISYSRK